MIHKSSLARCLGLMVFVHVLLAGTVALGAINSFTTPKGLQPAKLPKITKSPNKVTASSQIRVLLVQDALPWDNDSDAIALSNAGINYTVINSADLVNTNLEIYDCLMYASDQPTSYYQNIAANINRINSFVASGKILVAHSCDNGWQGGSWEGLAILPGNIGHVIDMSQTIHITQPSHPVVQGLTDSYFLNWDASTHGYFTSLPANADVIMEAGAEKPTYIEYVWGSGKVIATMQTIEWGYGDGTQSYTVFRPLFLENEINYVSAFAAFRLTFPLEGYSPTTAPVSAVMDNSVLERTPIEFYVPGDLIKAFNGEIGEKQYGVKYLDPYGKYWPAYKNSGGTDFFPASGAGIRPLNYVNGAYLSYAGNAGYNYDVPEGSPVVATGDGKLYKAVTDPVNGAGYSYYYNSYIDHGNGYYSWYLYAPLNADILAQINQNGYAQVTRGQVIGQTIGGHLHFEVRLNGIDHENVVDPYKLGLWLQTRKKTPIPWIQLLLQD
ncbi:MAG: M23 family metallopeptidase [Thermodesulfobacteriota bacterium]